MSSLMSMISRQFPLSTFKGNFSLKGTILMHYLLSCLNFERYMDKCKSSKYLACNSISVLVIAVLFVLQCHVKRQMPVSKIILPHLSYKGQKGKVSELKSSLLEYITNQSVLRKWRGKEYSNLAIMFPWSRSPILSEVTATGLPKCQQYTRRRSLLNCQEF